MTDADLLEHIGKLPHARGNFKQLVRELGTKTAGRTELETALARLVARGDLIELRSGHFAVTARSREFAAGRLNMHRDGYGFLISDRPMPGITSDIFIPPEQAKKAMHGDRVVVRIARIEADGRADGEIVKVLKRAHPTVVGEFRIGRRGQYVVPHEGRIQQWIEIPDGMEMPPATPVVDRIGVAAPSVPSVADLNGMIVNVEVLEYPEKGENPIGRVIEILGHPDDFGVNVETVIRKHHLPNRFPPEVIEQAEAVPNAIEASELAGRRDFRGMDVVTIDGETARDFDDAVWVDRLANGNYALQVHIADVSHYVRPGTPIDVEARLRGTSVYFPDRAVPMLPYELSTNICSLLPHEDRLVLSALMEIDHQGGIVSQEFMPGVIRSVERMTYTSVHQVLEGDADLRQRYQPLVARFELMRELALILNRKRVRRGSIDFDLPEPLIEFDQFGEMTGVKRAPRNIAHSLIEEFMLAANEAVASHLQNSGVASIYRIHEKPDPKRVMEFEEVAAHFGCSLGVGAIPVKRFGITDRHRDGTKRRREIELADTDVNITSRHYQRLVAKIEGKPEERILSYLMLRSLKQARYSTDNVGHFALAAETYTHFTSPIRRYPDLVVHRLLRGVLAGQAASLPPEPALAAIAAECSQSERRAADAERELVEWKKVRFMADRVGQDFDALVIGVTKYGLFVELADLFIEGLVPVDTLPGDEYTYQESVRKIVGKRTRREFAAGDSVRVILDRVDANERKLQFSILEMSATRFEPSDMIRIPGGGFLMGQDDGRDDERPAHRVTLAPFLLCRYQTTDANYETFRRVTMRERPEFTCPTQPATLVNWFDAVAYCTWLSTQWDGHFRLPTEAEWEFAARGGWERRLYPWGDAAPDTRSGYAERWRDGPEPVGTSEPNDYGLFDICENVHEWCADWYDPGYYAASPAENPTGPATGKRRASRGGAWRHHVKAVRCAARSSIPPEFRYADYGFRVAGDL